LTALTGGSRAAVQAGDLVLAVNTIGATSTGGTGITDGTLPYTGIALPYANGVNYDASGRVAYKFMGSTPDTTATFDASGNAQWAQERAVYVFSGVDPTIPFDVTTQIITGTGTGRPNPASITPITTGAEIVVIGAGAAATGAGFTSGDLTNFITQSFADTIDAMLGIGRKSWTGGAFDPAQFGGGTTGTGDSWWAVTLALRPALPELIYKGAAGQGTVYLGTRTEAQLYLGAKDLWP
jgi:hypothetical protein